LPPNVGVHLYHISDTVPVVIFKLNPAAGQPLYLQLIQQIRHAIETGVLDHGDVLPGIRTLAEKLVVSPNTIAKAYSELEHEGLLDLRHGSGAYVTARQRVKSRADSVRGAQARIGKLVDSLRDEGFSDEEIHRMLEAELFYEVSRERKP
jgi:GntR family transcriptional regulator